MDLHRIKQMAEAGSLVPALSYLSHWLAPGDPQTFTKVQEIIDTYPRASIKEQKDLWVKVWEYVQQLSSQSKTFLNQFQQGESYLDQGEWIKASRAFKNAVQLHQPRYQVKISQLQQRLQQADLAQEMAALIESANEAYLIKDWEKALISFRQVLSIHQQDLGVDKDELREVIRKCERGSNFQQYYLGIQRALAQRNIPQAKGLLAQAISFWEPDFEPSKDVLILELEQLSGEMVPAQTWYQSAKMKLAILGSTLLLATWGAWAMFEASQKPDATYTSTTQVVEGVPSKFNTSQKERLVDTLQAPIDLQDEMPLEPNLLKEASLDAIPDSSEELETPLVLTEEVAPNIEEEPLLATDSSVGADIQSIKATSSIDSIVPEEEPERISIEDIPSTLTAPEPAVPLEPFSYADQMPSFPGGESQLSIFLKNHVDYPELARENAIQGTVYVQFVVQADGSLNQARVVRGIGFGCNEEALQVVQEMPQWLPGQHQGQVVPVTYTLPVIFKLQ